MYFGSLPFPIPLGRITQNVKGDEYFFLVVLAAIAKDVHLNRLLNCKLSDSKPGAAGLATWQFIRPAREVWRLLFR